MSELANTVAAFRRYQPGRLEFHIAYINAVARAGLHQNAVAGMGKFSNRSGVNPTRTPGFNFFGTPILILSAQLQDITVHTLYDGLAARSD